MPDRTSTKEPWKVWFRTVQKQHRLRIGSDLANVVTWLLPLSESSKQCKAWIGSFDQLRIAPELPNSEARKKLSASLAEKPALVQEADSTWVSLGRYAATGWEINCAFEKAGDRFTIVLPEEPRLLGIVPNQGEIAAVFGMGAILEVWRAENWLQHVGSTEVTGEQALEEALRSLDERD